MALTYAVGAVAAQAAPRAIHLPALAFATLLLPIAAWRRPRLGPAVLCALLAGGAAGSLARQAAARDCSRVAREGQAASVRGHFSSRPGPGRRSAPFILAGRDGSCGGAVRIVLPRGVVDVEPGRSVDVGGRWRRTAGSGGALVYAENLTSGAEAAGIAPKLAVLRDNVEQRLALLYPRVWGVVHALVLARKDGLDPEVREAFAVAGLAHLLAISGFHVGVIAALLFVALRAVGAGVRGATVLASMGVWGYVACIGAPDAAARAATLLTMAAWARLRRYPSHRAGALAAALLLMVAADPAALARVGLQLSFAGAAGLAFMAAPVERALGRGRGRLVPRGVRSALAAGVAATAYTLPLVVWHFERLSLVGIPATLVAAPLVAMAIPGIFGTLVLAIVAPPAAAFLAGGVEWVLEALLWLVRAAAALPFAAAWVPRAWVPVGGAAGLGVLAALRVWGSPLTPRARRFAAGSAVTGALIVWPTLTGTAARGTLEIVVLDVGQGDAIAIRSPRGRWVLIDAGPAGERYDAGERVVVPYLRGRGAGVLEAMILTHPDLDHIGGAPAVLEGLEVRVVFDPGFPSPGAAYLNLLEGVERENAPWLPLRAGRVLELDGALLRVLHPAPGESDGSQSSSRNDRSVVLLLSFGDFSALLTGDAEAQVEARLARTDAIRSVDLLKVGHHGSATSTTQVFLDFVAPEVAAISVGRGNRHGHPAQEVLARLESSGVEVFRTDRHGNLRIYARREGTFRVDTDR